MTERDLQELETAARIIVTVLERHRVRDELCEERRAFLRFVPPQQTTTPDAGTPGEEDNERAFLKFTDKELLKMPKFFKTDYKLKGGNVAHIRRKANGTFEIRYRRNGLNLSVSAKNLENAKERFIEKLNSLSRTPENKNVKFSAFALQWLDVVKRPSISANTYDDYKRILQNYVFPSFGNVPLKDVHAFDVQRILSDKLEGGNGRTSTMIYTILRALFEFAVAEDLISKSPMTVIKKPKYEVQHGQALTVDEERAFVARCLKSSSPLRYAFLFYLYTGIRRSELASAELSEKWITVTTAKARKGETKKKRKIPISPMLRKYLPKMTKKALAQELAALTHEFPKFAPGHHLHDLRHTFITRCQECGISRELTSLWAGHKADNTMTSNVYTHLSEEFQLKEAQKLTY